MKQRMGISTYAKESLGLDILTLEKMQLGKIKRNDQLFFTNMVFLTLQLVFVVMVFTQSLSSLLTVALMCG